MKKLFVFFILVAAFACNKKDSPKIHYYEIGVKHVPEEWRDSAFVVATTNAQLINEINAQMLLPVAQRKMVNGFLLAGSGGYNKNASHTFKWHFKEDDWKLAEAGIEIYDGRPYSDVDSDTTYWLHTMTRFSPWSSYIKKELTNR